LCESNDGRAWIILDQPLFEQAKKQAVPWRALWFHSLLALLTIYFNKKKSDTLEGLATACGFDPATFVLHIETYNKSSRGEVEDPQHKAEEFHAVLDKGPYYALDIGKHSNTFALAVISFGGLVVEEKTAR
jgi:3-oxo-5alpha-steroid 4-dehydrogenase